MLQTPNRPTEKTTRKGARRWLKFSLAGLALIVIGAMALGIISTTIGNKSESASSPAAVTEQNTSDTVYRGAAGGMAPAPTYAPAKGAPAMPTVAAAAPAQGGASYNSGSSSASTGSSYNVGNNLQSDHMIIRNATISVQADDVEKLLSDVRALAAEQNGGVMQASTSVRDNKTYANITIQVPSQAFDNTVSRIRKLAFKVDSENTTSQDVTEEFVDTDAQVRNLKATEAAYLELLRKATNINDTISIQRELSYIRGEIERRQGRLNFLQKKSDFSTITLSIAPRLSETSTTTTANAWDVGKVFEKAWEGSLRGLQGLATVLITIAVYAWWVLPLLLVGYFVVRFGWKRANQSLNRPTPPAPPAAPTQQNA